MDFIKHVPALFYVLLGIGAVEVFVIGLGVSIKKLKKRFSNN
ncbi:MULTISPECIES: hypothetical protein [unclassified Shewanella]|jgi:hypothetical protein|nr:MULTISPECIES: hypothetical protein [unclassified Shewanella]